MFEDIIKEKKIDWNVPLKEMVKMKNDVIERQQDMLLKYEEEIKMLQKEIGIFKENFDCAMELLKEAKEEIFSLRKNIVVRDMNDVEIKPSCLVFVHQEEEIKKGVVMEVFPDRPTCNGAGFWVDIDCGEGVEGMMSYVLEVR